MPVNCVENFFVKQSLFITINTSIPVIDSLLTSLVAVN